MFSTKIAKNKGHVFTMENGGYFARLMQAEKLEDRGYAHGLPSGTQVPVYPIASLPNAPESWVREAGTYVCPVSPNKGLWFDWTLNDRLNTAIIPSVKGMNPITGMKFNGFQMEQYKNKCPKHGINFSHDRYCEECGYKWPAQNYITNPDTLWWDGFRQQDGKVRQFFFTDEDERDIASYVIGKENTVPAFGFVFYKQKVTKKPPIIIKQREYIYESTTKAVMVPYYGLISEKGNAFLDCYSSESSYVAQANSICRGVSTNQSSNYERTKSNVSLSRSVSIGAGSEISQDVTPDKCSIDEWSDEPVGKIRLYFCFKDQFESIVKNGGIKEQEIKKEGFMNNLPVG